MFFSLMPYLAAGGLLLTVVWVIFCLQAEAPKAGTLEWIAMYEKPNYNPLASQYALTGKDVLLSLTAFVLQAGVFLLFTFLGTVKLQANANWLALLPRICTMGLAAAVLWLTAKQLTASTLAAYLASVLFAGDPYHDPAASLALLTVLLTALLWYTRKAEKSGLGLLTIFAAAFSTTLFLSPVFAVLCAPALLMILLDGVWRCRHTDAGAWLVPVGVLLYATLTVVFTIVGFAAIVLIGFDVDTVLETLQSGMFFRAYLSYFFSPGSFMLLSPVTVALLGMQLPALLMTLGSLVLLVVGLCKRKDSVAGFLLLWMLSLAFLSLCSASPLFSLTAPIGCAYFSGRLVTRKHPVAAIVGAVFAAVITLLSTVLFYF